MRLLIIDNYDSFTYNLVQYLAEAGATVEVVRNDATTAEALLAGAPDAVVISPGPGDPSSAGISLAVVLECARTGTPLLGVCLGHQSIGQAFGGRIVRARSIMHGKVSKIEHDGRGVFRGLPSPFEATRYHSLVVDRATVPDCLEITAEVDGIVMALRHRDLPVEGVQFHPESILSVGGHDLLRNFLAFAPT